MFFLRASRNLHTLPGPGLMEGNMRGPSSADCEKSFVRTGITTAGMLARQAAGIPPPGLIQIESAHSSF